MHPFPEDIFNGAMQTRLPPFVFGDVFRIASMRLLESSDEENDENAGVIDATMDA
jgi:hypothetical protein